MLKRIVIHLVVLAVVIGLVAGLMPGIEVHGGVLWLIWVALLFSLVNLVIGPILTFFSLPFILLTLGLFLFVVNAALLAITAGLSSHLDVDNFGAALLGALLITVFSWLAHAFLPIAGGRSRTSAGARVATS